MCCPSEGASVGMISVDCINFNSVGVQEPKLHEIDEMGYLDGGCASRLSANKAHQIWEPLASQIYLSGKRRTLGSDTILEF